MIKKLISEEKIQTRVQELGRTISEDYGEQEILLLGILKGSILFYGDLARQITSPVSYEFMQVGSYANRTEPSEIEVIYRPNPVSIKNKHVLIVDDIVDTGQTMNFLTFYVKQFEPASLKVCAFLNKPERRKIDVQLDYYGYKISNYFVVGYGLDYAQRYRNLPYIGVLDSQNEGE